MMQYSKGDTIELKDGSLAIVLNNGIKGEKFVERYIGQKVIMLCSAISLNLTVVKYHGEDYSTWYNIMIGDDKIWAADAFLYFRVHGTWD